MSAPLQLHYCCSLNWTIMSDLRIQSFSTEMAALAPCTHTNCKLASISSSTCCYRSVGFTSTYDPKPLNCKKRIMTCTKLYLVNVHYLRYVFFPHWTTLVWPTGIKRLITEEARTQVQCGRLGVISGRKIHFMVGLLVKSFFLRPIWFRTVLWKTPILRLMCAPCWLKG